jgi:rhamnulokinase
MVRMAAVDLGAQSGRVAVGELESGRLTFEEVHRFENTPVEERGVLRWDVERLFDEATDGLRAAAREAPLASVAVDSWAVDFGLVDSSGQLICRPVHYRDTRRADAVDSVYARVPPRELYERTGIQLMGINTIFELAAMTLEADRALDEADRLLLIADLLHHRLCGATSSEFTNATTTQCFDPRTGDWAYDVLERIGIPTRLLPEVVPPATPIGRTEEGAQVIAVATHDTGSAVAAVPFRDADSVFLSVGTWSLVGLEIDEPLITDKTFAANLTNEGGVAGTFRLLRNVTGLWLLHECRRGWESEGHSLSFAEMVALADAAPSLRSLIDPDDELLVGPGSMPARIAELCRVSGQPAPEEPGAVARCVLESIALKHAVVVDRLREVKGTSPTDLHVVGGGTRNELLCRWTAEAAGLPVVAGPEEATLIGNLLVQAMALGELGSLEEARDVVRASFVPAEYEPSFAPAWAEARERFAELISGATLEVGS